MSDSGLPQPLPDALVALISERMSVLGDSTRIRVLDQLRLSERNVQSIADGLATTQQNVSGHLRLLYASRVVDRRVEGRLVFYSLSDRSVLEVWAAVVVGLVDDDMTSV